MSLQCKHVEVLSEKQLGRLHKLVDPFEEHWSPTEVPDLDGVVRRYGAELPKSNPLRSAVVIDLAKFDCGCRIKSGLPVDVASHYMDRYPELNACRACLIELFERAFNARGERAGAGESDLEDHLRSVPPAYRD